MRKARRSGTESNLVASLLTGAWRPSPPAATGSHEELDLITPLLMETGAAALAWRRVRHSDLESSPVSDQLHDAYRFNKLLAIIYRRDVAAIFRLLRSHRIEPILVKGWAVARHYAEPFVRPCGDVDLCVREEQYRAAQAVLKERATGDYSVDLHAGFRNLDDRSFCELMARSELLEIEGESIRVLSPEDHLRVLCYHFLREGGWRPLWLCDISVALESRPYDFDWDLCLGGKRRRADWVTCAVGLAHRLVGAQLSGTPAAVRNVRLPGWLVPSILREWEVRSMYQRHRAPMTSALSHPLRTLRSLRHHWPTPVEATVTLGAPFNELPRLPFQAVGCLSRAVNLLRATANPTAWLRR
jgi:hypothetical protein